MKKRNVISIILSLAFVILLLPQLELPTSAASNATTIDVSDSNPISMPLGVSYSSGVYTIGLGANNTSITLTGTGTNTINVAPDVTGLTLNLDGVCITSGTASPINISTKYEVTLHLNDGKANELHATGSGFFGIQSLNKLTITGNTGSLDITGIENGINGAGLLAIKGGSILANGGTNGICLIYKIIVNGGTISASGGTTGIKSGEAYIAGGTVKAKGITGIDVDGNINLCGGTTTAIGSSRAIKASTKDSPIPFVTLENGVAVTVASTNIDGSSPVPYNAAQESIYKYLKIEVPPNSTINPTTAIFNKYTGSHDYKDIGVTLTLSGNTLGSIWNGSTQLVENTDYTVSGTTVTLLKTYMASRSADTTTLTFKFSAGSDQTLSVTVNDTTPPNSTISPTTAIFNKYTCSTDYKDIGVTLTLSGNTLGSIWNCLTQLVENTDYTVSGTTVTIPKAYLTSQPAGTTNLTFKFSAGSDQTLSVTVNNTTPSDSTISPTTAIFNKYTSSPDYKDIGVTLTLNGNTLSGIWNGSTQLVKNTDYTVSGTTVTIPKAYLTSQPAGTTTLTFKFSVGSDLMLAVTVSDTTPSSPSSGGSSGSGGSNTPKVTTTTAGTGTAVVTTVSTAVTGTTSGSSQTVTIPKDTVAGLTDAAEKFERAGGIDMASIDTGAASGLSQVGVTIPGASFDEFAAKTKAALRINTGLGSVTFSGNAVDKICAAGSGDVTFGIGTVDNKSLSAAMQKLVGSRPIYRFSVTVGDLKVSEFGSSVIVTLPYTLAAEEDTNAIVVYYIDASGTLKTMQGKYDAKTGSVIFKTTHFSEYMIGYHKADFTDVSSSAWYADAVTFLAARGITSGTSDATFCPNVALTRGQFIVMLLRAYGIAADTSPTDNFTDAGNTYYTGYIAAAKRLGITSGVGGNKFAPDKTITRQEMFTLLYNTLKTMGQLPSTDSEKKLSDFSDAGQVNEWAAGAIAPLVKAGIVSGNSGNLAPVSMATRAEMAQVLYNILKQ